ncbi:hypothetical protein QQF64_008901 [Cirrhinus molitorella]|uniref:Ig-like domain-containing protein n=1 Tax=Cirrhinus molitorella TaxID=172907 RepID=A0ABR3MAU7_9TELE
MNNQKRYSISFLVFVLVSGSARVWVDQSPTEEDYKEGDTATLLCQIHSDQEQIENCEFLWYIWNEIIPSRTISVENAHRYQDRATMEFNQTTASLTVKDLSVNDTDQLRCIAECFVDKELTRYLGKGTTLLIHDKNEKNEHPSKVPVLNAELDAGNSLNPWIGFLLLSLNITIFIIITVVCVSIIKKMRKK